MLPFSPPAKSAVRCRPARFIRSWMGGRMHFRALVDHTPDMILRFDRDGRCTYANPAVTAITGLAGDQLVGKTMQEAAVQASFAAHCEDAIRTVILTRQALVFECALPAKASLRNFQARVVPEPGPDGKVASVLLVARDISAIKGDEAVLRESEQRIRGIAANIPGMVFQCQLRRRDDALFFTYVSEGCQMLGMTPGALQARGQRILDYIAEADRAAFLDSLRASARAMTMWHWVGATIPIDGAVRWLDCRATPRATPDGVMWEGVMMDITDSQRREQELRQSRQLLRELSAHMDSVREEERKRIAREMHDELGQVLTALRMEVGLLRLHHGAGNAALQAQVAAMTATVDRTIRVVRDVTAALRPAELDLGPTAAIAWLLAEYIKRSGIDCTFANQLADDLALDEARATALFRIVQESLTNVARHAAATAVQVDLALLDDGQLYLRVADNGQGFWPDAPRKTGSFGLVGLRERVLALGGTLRIDSAPGAGCRVEVRMPAGVCGAGVCGAGVALAPAEQTT